MGKTLSNQKICPLAERDFFNRFLKDTKIKTIATKEEKMKRMTETRRNEIAFLMLQKEITESLEEGLPFTTEIIKERVEKDIIDLGLSLKESHEFAHEIIIFIARKKFLAV